MTIQESLKHIIDAQFSITDTYGSGSTEENIAQFLADPNGADFNLVFFVGGISLSFFFAASTVAFGDEKTTLWDNIQTLSGKPNMAQPTTWDSSNTLLQIAVYVQAS